MFSAMTCTDYINVLAIFEELDYSFMKNKLSRESVVV